MPTPASIRRYADDRRWIHEDTPGRCHSWLTNPELDGDEMIAAFLWEAAYTALTHPDPKIVLRATLQLAEYVERVRGTKHQTSLDQDLLREARARLEPVMPRAFPEGRS